MENTCTGWKTIVLICGCFLSGGLVVGCKKVAKVDVGTSQGTGVVRRVDYKHRMFTVDHEKIPNLLQAMTFSYPVASDSVMNGLLPEDTVSFVLLESSPGQFSVQSVKRLSSPKKRSVPILPEEIAGAKAVTVTTKKKTVKR